MTEWWQLAWEAPALLVTSLLHALHDGDGGDDDDDDGGDDDDIHGDGGDDDDVSAESLTSFAAPTMALAAD